MHLVLLVPACRVCPLCGVAGFRVLGLQGSGCRVWDLGFPGRVRVHSLLFPIYRTTGESRRTTKEVATSHMLPQLQSTIFVNSAVLREPQEKEQLQPADYLSLHISC